VQAAIAKGLVSMGHARALLALPSAQEQRRWMERVVRDDLSVRQVEQLVKVVPKPVEANRRGESAADGAWVGALEARLRRRFGTKVVVANAAGYRGELRIEYVGKHELERILELLDPVERL
jgi:ParB family transcriptional regulator, chromosome partitioning protein